MEDEDENVSDTFLGQDLLSRSYNLKLYLTISDLFPYWFLGTGWKWLQRGGRSRRRRKCSDHCVWRLCFFYSLKHAIKLTLLFVKLIVPYFQGDDEEGGGDDDDDDQPGIAALLGPGKLSLSLRPICTVSYIVLALSHHNTNFFLPLFAQKWSMMKMPKKVSNNCTTPCCYLQLNT